VFGKILADQAVHIFVRAALPLGIRVSEVKVGFKTLSNVFMFGELLTVICGQGENFMSMRPQQPDDCGSDLGRGFTFNFGDQGQASFAFGQ